MLKADSGKESDYLHRGEDPHMERPDMRKGMILTAIIILLGPLALFALPSTVTFNIASTVALINQIQIKGANEDNSAYGSSFTFNFDELTQVDNRYIADLKYTTNSRTGVTLGIVGSELKSTENNVIPYTLTLGASTTIKVGYAEDNNPEGTIPTPSQFTQLTTTTAEVHLTIPGSVSDYPAGAYTGTITFTLGAK